MRYDEARLQTLLNYDRTCSKKSPTTTNQCWVFALFWTLCLLEDNIWNQSHKLRQMHIQSFKYLFDFSCSLVQWQTSETPVLHVILGLQWQISASTVLLPGHTRNLVFYASESCWCLSIQPLLISQWDLIIHTLHMIPTLWKQFWHLEFAR